MYYHAYELAHAWITPLRAGTRLLRQIADHEYNPVGRSPAARGFAAACEMFDDLTRRYGKPDFGISETSRDGVSLAVYPRVALEKPFCDLVHVARATDQSHPRDPRVLVVAPLSGHYATLLRGTLRALLPDHNVYFTDWRDARGVPLAEGGFDLDDYIDYVIAFLRFLGPDTHVIAVCQPAVPVLAAAALMAARKDPCEAASITLMGGPIDTRRNPTAPNRLAESHDIHWFERNVISNVPLPHPGFMRRVYPGFVQLSGFMSMNLDRHVNAHMELFNHLVEGDCDSVEQHRKFYDEYMSVMDLPAEFYLQTIKTVFQDHALPDGKMTHRGEPVDCSAIVNPTLLTVEGENDDICGVGQTHAAHDLCTNIPADRRHHYMQPGVGHYGVFNGTRWRTEIQPRIGEMIRATEAAARR